MWPGRRGLMVCGGVGGVGVAVAAMGLKKRRAPGAAGQEQRFWLRSAAFVIPHPDKAHVRYNMFPTCGGEDAYFIGDDGESVGVADGVGGWSSYGIDPGIFSRQLMHFSAAAARAGLKDDPVRLLEKAHSQTTAKGSSTALVMTLSAAPDGSGQILRAANVGDSGFMLLRDGQVLMQSPPQQYSFNFPYQLGAPGLSSGGCSPRDAQTFEIKDVKIGDVIVLGTDGLFDNVFPHEIAATVAQSCPSCANAQGAARTGDVREASEALARLASRCAADKARDSPFAQEALRAGLRFQGGKLDDITVVVSTVADSPPEDAHGSAPRSRL
eukprot:TRINITY_DN22061_c0_g1_i1.p1 TRINITY_DN22061_c0_g1~~TRINITY_DN22061_c0_g1_i1.p1  ORF type:complete len:326 (+),score=72.15 TRINITY_DN22061_c0_g1_i1:113-1090(+)